MKSKIALCAVLTFAVIAGFIGIANAGITHDPDANKLSDVLSAVASQRLVATTLASAQSYAVDVATSAQVAAEEHADSGIAAALSTAQSYTNSTIAANLTTLSFSDTDTATVIWATGESDTDHVSLIHSFGTDPFAVDVYTGTYTGGWRAPILSIDTDTQFTIDIVGAGGKAAISGATWHAVLRK